MTRILPESARERRCSELNELHSLIVTFDHIAHCQPLNFRLSPARRAVLLGEFSLSRISRSQLNWQGYQVPGETGGCSWQTNLSGQGKRVTLWMFIRVFSESTAGQDLSIRIPLPITNISLTSCPITAMGKVSRPKIAPSDNTLIIRMASTRF